LYVAEAGARATTEMLELGPRAKRFRSGWTSRVSRITPDRQRDVVLDQLPSFSNGDDELGAADVAFMDGMLYVLMATGGYELGTPEWDNVILQVDLSTSPPSVTSVFNLTDYNLANPSLSRLLDPVRTNVAGGMPFGMAALNDSLYVTDGNQEHVTQIGLDGRAQRILQYPASNRVLTGITPGPDGALYVAEFGPAPHKNGSALITRLTEDGQAADLADGFVNAIDVAFDAAGQLHILEFAAAGMRIGRSGRVLRVESDGQRTPLVEGLNYPTSLTFGPDNDLYVTVNGHQSDPGTGLVIRVPISPVSTN
jgi:hypothetical protein